MAGYKNKSFQKSYTVETTFFGYCAGFLLSGFGFGGAILEAEAVIAGLDNVAMMGKAVE